MELEWCELYCPYCGEPFTTAIDLSAGAQDYIEDCPVCCHPIEFSLSTDGQLTVRRDNE